MPRHQVRTTIVLRPQSSPCFTVLTIRSHGRAVDGVRVTGRVVERQASRPGSDTPAARSHTWPVPLFRVIAADLARNPDHYGKVAVVLFRLSQATGPLGVVFTVMLRVLCGADIPRSVIAGPGLRIAHGGSGLVVHPDVRLGAGCVLFQGVTLGVSGRSMDAPTLDDRVYVGAGAVVLGGVKLGFRSRVGANAVARADVPPYSTAVGTEGRIIIRTEPAEWD